MEIINILQEFGITMSALFLFAIWTNKKFNIICERISKIEGRIKI